MQSGRRASAGVVELRLAWLLIGALALALHYPWTPAIVVALAVPWAAVMVLLARRDTSPRLAAAWPAALASRTGGFGAATLLLVVMATAVVVAPGAAALLAILLAAALSLAVLTGGADRLAEHLGGWAFAAVATGGMLVLAEITLRNEDIAARVGTPREIDRWWQRYDDLWLENVLNIRSPYETLHKDERVVRIAALGDSFTWGDKIASSDSTWPALLEAELQRQNDAARFEVVNLGQKGFTTVNEAEMLRRVGWQFDPDLVLVQFYLNDILPSGPNFERGYSGWIFPRAWLLPQRYRNGRAGRTALLHLAENVMTARKHGDRAQQVVKWTELYVSRGPEWQALEAALHEMGAAAAARNVPIVLVLFPDFIPGMADMDELPFARIHAQVTDAAAAAGFTVLDLSDAFVAANPDMRHWWATSYDTHPNVAATRLAAERIAAHLIAAYPEPLRLDAQPMAVQSP